MSARALNWALEQKPDTTTQKLVLVCLGDRADDDGECWPSLHWISAKCAPLSEQAAKRALAALCEQGLLTKVARRRRSNQTLGSWILRLPVDEATGHQRSLAYAEPQVMGELAEEPSSKELTVVTDVTTAAALHSPLAKATAANAQTILAELIDAAAQAHVPLPGNVKAQLGRALKQALADCSTQQVVAGARLMIDKGMMRPALLGQFITEAALPRPQVRKYGYGMTERELTDWANSTEPLGANL